MTPLKIRKLDPSRKALTQRCSASREPASWRVGQFAFALLISLCAKPGQAFTPVAQLDITDAVDTNIIEIGRIQNVDFYFADSPIPQPDDTLQGYLKNAEPTGIVVGTYPFKSPSSVTWVGLILNNKSRHSKLYFDDFAQRPPGIIDIFQRSTDGALTKLPLAEDQTVKIAGRSYGLNLEKGEKTTIFVRIKSKSFEQLNLGIGSESSLIISGQRRSFWYGLVSASTFFILALQISLLIAKRGLPQILGLARLIVTALFSMSAYGLNLRFFGDGSIMIPRELTMSLLQLGSL
ncbi:MAG: hypothetical protein NTV34_15255, partial [Proteobacteria bacterium]|nr:hypothetical protein [Pseudomonadota bacterium]